MATDCLFRDDSYLRHCDASVIAASEHGLDGSNHVGWLARAECAR